MVGPAGCPGRGALVPRAGRVGRGEQAAAVVGPAEVVGGADQPDAGGEGRLGAGDGPPPPGEWRAVGAEGRVEPLAVGGVDAGASRRRLQDGRNIRQGAAHDSARAPDDVPLIHG